MVRLAAFHFKIKHRPGKQYTNADGMPWRPLLKCAQCEICHQRVSETKWGKKVELVITESSAQTETPVKKRLMKGKTEALSSIQLEGDGGRWMSLPRTAIDLMGPYPESEKGNKYILVIVDSFSKWMEAYPVPNIEAKTIAEKFVMELISCFGAPIQIKSYRGKQFNCKLCYLLDAEHKISNPFHPQGNSRVERMVKVVGNLIAVFCQTYKDWDKNLPLLTLVYTSRVYP